MTADPRAEPPEQPRRTWWVSGIALLTRRRSMVDLRHSLRPTGTVSPLPVSEIATRVKRRKRRRLVTATGFAAATMAIAAFAVSNMPGSPVDTVTVANGTEGIFVGSPELPTDNSANRPSTPTTLPPNVDSATSTESATSSTGAHPMTTPGIRTSTTTTSEWEDGYCIQTEVINDTVDSNAWQVVLDVDGTIATLWNATVVEAGSGTFVFSGEQGYNAIIEPGAVTSFGTCVDTSVG